MPLNYLILTEKSYTAAKALWDAWYALLKVVLVGKGESADALIDLEPQCSHPYDLVTEERKHAWVEFYVAALNAGVDFATLPVINGCDDIIVNAMVLVEEEEP